MRLLKGAIPFLLSIYLLSCNGLAKNKMDAIMSDPTMQPDIMSTISDEYKLKLETFIDSLKTNLKADSIIQTYEFAGYNNNGLYSYDYHLSILKKEFQNVQISRFEELSKNIGFEAGQYVLGVKDIRKIKVSFHSPNILILKKEYDRLNGFDN